MDLPSSNQTLQKQDISHIPLPTFFYQNGNGPFSQSLKTEGSSGKPRWQPRPSDRVHERLWLQERGHLMPVQVVNVVHVAAQVGHTVQQQPAQWTRGATLVRLPVVDERLAVAECGAALAAAVLVAACCRRDGAERHTGEHTGPPSPRPAPAPDIGPTGNQNFITEEQIHN